MNNARDVNPCRQLPDENNVEKRETEKRSAVLESILGNHMSTEEFFGNVWQEKPFVFPFPGAANLPSADNGGDGSWNDDSMQATPFQEVIKQGWSLLVHLLQQSKQGQTTNEANPPPEHKVPLIFQNKELKGPDEVEALYGSSPFASYLDGCSVVLNHGDLLSPWIAALCQDLQNYFPHAYANCYLTPPNSQAVHAHADDRDVLVIQILGAKEWQVYQSIPVLFPYPHEQVGKDDIPVPQQVLEGPRRISTTLTAGDVLYMPRGFVHQAKCSDTLSFHITVALATHDWTLAGMMSMATEKILTQVIDYRKSILPLSDPNFLQVQVDGAMKMLQEQITAETILKNLHTRLENHNRRSFPPRMQLIHEARFPSTKDTTPRDIVGPKAANRVVFTSTIRAATQDERARVPANPSRPQGLNVREEIADTVMAIISKLKADPTIQCRVVDLRKLSPKPNHLLCDFALLCLAKRAVELGAVAVVSS